MLNDTLLGFKTLAASAQERTLVVWVNEYFGPVEREGKTLDQMQVYLDNQESVGLRQRNPDTFGDDVRIMRENKLTFGEAIGTKDDELSKWPEFSLMMRHRLGMVRRDLFEQLEQTPFA